MLVPSAKIPDPPASHLLVGFVLIVLYLATTRGVSALYYKRTGRRHWRFSDGMSSFPLFHFNAREWGLLILAFATFMAVGTLAAVFLSGA